MTQLPEHNRSFSPTTSKRVVGEDVVASRNDHVACVACVWQLIDYMRHNVGEHRVEKVRKTKLRRILSGNYRLNSVVTVCSINVYAFLQFCYFFL